MSNIKIEVSLVSELTSYAPTPDADFSNPEEFFDYLFHNDGGIGIRAYPTSPCVKPDLDFDPTESIFSNLDWNLDSDPAIVEDTYESYENLTFTGSQLDGWDFTYSFVNTFDIEITADSSEDAEQLLRESVRDYLAIFDSAVEETLEIEKVRIIHQK